jgi:hypothetical protein
MNVYIGDQARRIFYSLDIPQNSIGVFESNSGDWIYWFSDGWAYDSGSAENKIEALRKAKENFR